MSKGLVLLTFVCALALTAPAQQETANDSSLTAVTADQLVEEALRANPGLQSAQRMVEARSRRVPQAKALPDPTLSLGWAGDPVPFKVQVGDPSSARNLQVMQEFPLGGKRGLRGNVAEQEVEATRWEYERNRRRVAAEVKAAFFEYAYSRQALGTARKNQELLRKLARIAEVRYEVGKGMQPDVLRSHVELSRLQQRITTLEQQHDTARVRLNTLMARDPEAPLGPPAPVTPATLKPSLQELYQLARQNDPELKQQESLVARGEYSVQLARKEYVPDLGIGYMYQNRPGMPEMHGATFSINIPIFYKSKQRQMVEEARLELDSTAKARDERRNQLYFELKEQYLAAKASENLLRLYSQGVVPQSSLALESSMSAYETGGVDFLTVLANFTTVLDYETEYYREVANFQTALARMEPLVGAELTDGGEKQ